MDSSFRKSIFSFFLCETGSSYKCFADFNSSVSIAQFTLFTDSDTPLQYAHKGTCELVIFGYAVDVFSGESDNLAKTVLDFCGSLQDVIEYEKRLGGKYIIFYAENGVCYCLGDATCSLPIFYSVESKNVICCSNPKYIVDCFQLQPDRELQKIRNSGPLDQAMPYDLTPYSEIKQLLPNHYIDFSKQRARRFVNSFKKQKVITPKQAAEITAPMIESITKMYLSQFKVVCPITSGRDSRVVLAFLRHLSKEINTYTVWFDRFAVDEQDWIIPMKLSELGKINHQQIYKEIVSEEMKIAMDNILGENGYPEEAFSLSVTVDKNYPNCAAMEGDIIGQIGKCSLHRDIPYFLATPSYFRCKLHNYSNESKAFLRLWMKDITYSKEKINVFDLFSIENRLGIWASHTHLVRNIMGQTFVNIFNSRSIIYVWTAVKRSERMKSSIHIELIKLISPELLEIPFEKENNGLVNFAKSNWLFFYLATFAKYYVQKRKFLNE